MRKYYTHLTLIFLGLILYLMANFQRVAIPGAIFDSLQLDLSLQAYQVTVLGSIFMYFYALGLLFSGVLVDRFGPIKVIMGGSLLFVIGSLIFPNTNNINLLYFSRAILGFGAASFYLSLVNEVKKCFPDKYFSICISLMLITGYIGGFCANAPFIVILKHFSWQYVLNVVGIIALIACLLFYAERTFLHHIPKNEHASFSLKPFKEVLTNKQNYNLFAFGSLNYGLYYVIQTVIGVKFLKDFVCLSPNKASLILSFMIVIAGLSGLSMASLSSFLHNKRVIFMKIICFMSAAFFAIISLCITFDIKTPFIAVILLLIAISGGMTPLILPVLNSYNKYEIRSTALSIMDSFFFITVGILGNIVGIFLNLFPTTINKFGYLIYSKNSYLIIFLTFFICSLVEMFFVLKLKDI